MKSFDYEYVELIERVQREGVFREDRTGVGTQSIFGHHFTLDIREQFPLLRLKNTHWKSVRGELLWMLSGSTSARELRERYGVTIWDEWGDEDGELGPIYGHQWRSWGTQDGVRDQITEVIDSIKNDPWSRRHVVSAWNVADLDDMALAPCHVMFQFYVTPDEHGHPLGLSCQVYQRSADVFLGLPFNVASYALLTHMIAAKVQLAPGKLSFAIGDAHIYDNHRTQVEELLDRAPLADSLPEPRLRRPAFATGAQWPEFELESYWPFPTIHAEVAV